MVLHGVSGIATFIFSRKNPRSRPPSADSFITFPYTSVWLIFTAGRNQSEPVTEVFPLFSRS
jgi:hypothetical protein